MKSQTPRLREAAQVEVVWVAQCISPAFQNRSSIPEVLKLVDLQGAAITNYAIRTPNATAAQIVTGGGDYILALTGNQDSMNSAANLAGRR